MKEIKRILVISWTTQYCKKTIQSGVLLAEKFGAELFVVHMVNTLLMKRWNLPMITVMEEHKKDLDKLKQELDNVIDHEKKKGMAIKDFVMEGDPVEVILQTIRDEHIDLVVLRAHEEGFADRFLVGGSNDAIIRKMPCPIFLVND